MITRKVETLLVMTSTFCISQQTILSSPATLHGSGLPPNEQQYYREKRLARI